MKNIKRRTFLKNSAVAAAGLVILPSCAPPPKAVKSVLRTAHIGVGGMGLEDLKAMASHSAVEVTALCDVDSRTLKAAQALFPKAKAC